MHGIVRVSCSNGLDTASSSIGSRAWSGGGGSSLSYREGSNPLCSERGSGPTLALSVSTSSSASRMPKGSI
jgi:hypothetical protein